MVRALHEAGIEVILDVVYNHTAEGNHLGPDAVAQGHRQRRLLPPRRPTTRRYYMDYTGTGNSLNMRHPHTLQLVMDSLRYWVHGDARRRLPLRPGLHPGPGPARGRPAVGLLRPHPAGPGGEPGEAHRRTVGRRRGRLPGRQLPARCGRSGTASTATSSGTSGGARAPRCRSSPPGSPAAPTSTSRTGATRRRRVNFVTAHDGFTLADLVSYNDKHNEANGEDNRDGESHNRSWNCGVEGPTDDPEIRALRRRQQRNFLATLFLSQGVPMLLGGDEMGRTQGGNNNAYCQDNEISWFDWSLRGGERRPRRLDRRPGRLPPGRTRCSAAGASSRAARSTARPSPTSAGSRPTAPRCPRRTGTPASPSRSACSSTATPFPTPTPGARRSPTTASWCCSTPTTRPLPFTIPNRDWGDHWVVVLDTDDLPLRPDTAGGTGGPATVAWEPGLGEGEPVKKGEQIQVGRPVARGAPPCRLTGPPAERERRRNPWPLSTYRVQLQPAFGFDDVTAIAPYLRRLGVSHLYASPYLQAARRVDPRLRRRSTTAGSTPNWAARRATSGCAPPSATPGSARSSTSSPTTWPSAGGNRWWWDVLENGPSQPVRLLLRRRLGPARGASCGTRCSCRSSATTTAGCSKRARSAWPATAAPSPSTTTTTCCPVAPRSLDDLLAGAAAPVPVDGAGEPGHVFGRLPPSYLTDRASVRERHRDKEVLRASLARLLREEPDVAAAVDAEVAAHQRRPRPARRPARAPELPARLLAHRRPGARLPALLRHPHPGRRCGWRTRPSSSTPTSSSSSGSTTGWSTGCASTTPTGCATPRATCGACAHEAGPRHLGRGREDPRARRAAAAGVAGGRHDRLRLRQPGRRPASSTPPARSRSTRPTPPSPASTVDYDEVVYEKKHLVMSAVLSSRDQPADRRWPSTVCERHRRYRDFTRHDLARDPAGADRRLPRVPDLRGPRRRRRRPTTSPTWRRRPSWPGRGGPTSTGELFDFLVDILLGRHRGERRRRARAPGSSRSPAR